MSQFVRIGEAGVRRIHHQGPRELVRYRLQCRPVAERLAEELLRVVLWPFLPGRAHQRMIVHDHIAILEVETVDLEFPE